MPVKRVPAARDKRHDKFVAAITAELEKNQSHGPPDAPQICEEELPRSKFFQVTVIWDEWKDLDPRDRSAVILDAYREARGEDDMFRISRALGLTNQEAKKLGISE